jgi:hypothetical protein
MDAPHHVLLSRDTLAFPFEVLGATAATKGGYTVRARLEGSRGAVRAETRQDLADPYRIVLPVSGVQPGAYNLKLTLLDSKGETCSESEQTVAMHAGPL